MLGFVPWSSFLDARHHVALRALLFAAVAGCGGASPPVERAKPAASAPAPAASAADTSATSKDEAVPTTCANTGDDMCLPEIAFARRACQAGSPELALSLFSKSTPWVRAYLVRETEAWDASGGPSSSNKLKAGEEVLILVRRKPATGGMVVSGASGSYDVLRWDGTCASLQAEEVSLQPRGPLGYADIRWRKLDDDYQQALSADAKVVDLASAQKKECKGVSAGEVNAGCEKASKALSKAIVEFVRKGGALPPPPKLP